MSKDNKCDQGFECLKELINRIGQNFSESDTRAKIIDPLFKNCLGWTEDDIKRETHIHKGYLDYIFSIEGVPRFILEAKKIGKSFKIPASLGSRYYKISGTISTDKNIKQAIEQAQRYCINSGVRYGIVSNGHQFILFEAFKYGADWRSGNCVVFHSLEDIKNNFTIFWNTLSKDSVLNGSLRKYISQEELPLEFHRPIEYLHAKDSPITRNNLSPLLQPFIDHVFKDIIHESQLDVLKKCYVTLRQYKQAGLHINRHFDRPPNFAKKYKVEMIFESETTAGSFQELYEKSEKFLRTKAPRGTLVLLMGGIGSGKTTFIHHFFNFVIKEPEKTLWFYVNFLESPPDPDKIKDHVFKSIIKDFEIRYLAKLKKELSSVGLSSVEPNEKSLTILFSFLMLKGYTVSLVLDNVDQHSYTSSKYQEQALLIAKHLTEKFKTITILTLREESFFKSSMSGVLDAFPAPVFHISSPSFEKLVRYRINYMLDLLEKNDEEIRALTRSYVKLGSSKQVLKTFFTIIKNSFRSSRKKGREILRFMDDISGGDMRLALRFLRIFLVSGNTDVNEMLRIDHYDREQGGMGYQIPFHHVIKSIILEHSRLYSSSRSRIMNLFDVNSKHTNSHFLHLRILNYLYNRLSYQPPPGRGFVEIDGIIQEGERMLINRSAIADSLRNMALFGLVQFENQSKEGYETATWVRITNTGIYYLKELIYRFVYLDLVWMDTPIADEKVTRELLRHVVELRPKTENYLDERFQRTECFLNYLKQMEEREFKNNPQFNDSDLTKKRFMTEIIQSYQEAKKYIKSKRQRVISSLKETKTSVL